MGADGLADSRHCGDNSILNWAYWIIAWDCFGRGLMTEARKLGLAAHCRWRRTGGSGAPWVSDTGVVAWVHVLEARYDEAIIGARECLRNATTPFDQNVAAVAESDCNDTSGSRPRGSGKNRRAPAVARWSMVGSISDSGAHGPAGVGLVMSGQIAQGIRLTEDSIVAGRRVWQSYECRLESDYARRDLS